MPELTTAGEERIAAILERVRAIPEGFVQSYGDIDPHAPRLVGRVLATTDADVPWHRVVRADGSAAQGKRQLERLRREGVPMRHNRVDMPAARWPRGATPLKLKLPKSAKSAPRSPEMPRRRRW
jgi:methylated-DNA-protein-cysteine methyltransferase related protein